MKSTIVLVIFMARLPRFKAQPFMCITRRYTACYVMFQERDRIMHHLVVSPYACLSIPVLVIGRERSVSIHFIDLTAASAVLHDLLFLLVKHGNGATAPRLRQIISRRNATTFSIFRDPPYDGIKFACCHGMRIRSFHKRFYYIIEKKRFPAAHLTQSKITLEKSISTYTFDERLAQRMQNYALSNYKKENKFF